MNFRASLFLFILACRDLAKAQNGSAAPSIVDTNSTTTTDSPNAPPVTTTSAPVAAVDPDEMPECFDNLDVLTEFMMQQNVFLVETYILCPNTIFQVGIPTAGIDIFEGGSRPLSVRSNSRILCGKDGKSSNNCVVSGGQYNFLTSSSALSSTESEVTNALVQGVTFEKGKSTGLIFSAPGNVTLEDCIIRDQNNLGAVRLLYEKNLQVRRSLAENHAEPNGVRRTQEATRQLVTFRNCTFSENTFIQATDDSLDYGIMILSNGDNDAILENCLFVNNAFSSNDPRIVTAAVVVGVGSTVVLKDNCFVNNTFANLGTVIVANSDGIKETSGNFGTVDKASKCPFIINEETKECLESFESATCKAHSISTPSTNETDSPSITSSQHAQYHFVPVIITVVISLLFGC